MYEVKKDVPHHDLIDGSASGNGFMRISDLVSKLFTEISNKRTLLSEMNTMRMMMRYAHAYISDIAWILIYPVSLMGCKCTFVLLLILHSVQM